MQQTDRKGGSPFSSDGQLPVPPALDAGPLTLLTIPSIDKGTHGFAEHKYAHTTSSPLAIRRYALRVFPCLDAFLLRQNCAAPVGDEFLRDFWLLRRRRAGARQAEKDEKRRKDTPTGGCALVCRWYLSIRAVPGHSMCHLGITNIPCSKHAKTGGAAPAVRRSRYRISASSDRCEVKIVGRLLARPCSPRSKVDRPPQLRHRSVRSRYIQNILHGLPADVKSTHRENRISRIYRKYRPPRRDLVLPQEVFSAIISR